MKIFAMVNYITLVFSYYLRAYLVSIARYTHLAYDAPIEMSRNAIIRMHVCICVWLRTDSPYVYFVKFYITQLYCTVFEM